MWEENAGWGTCREVHASGRRNRYAMLSFTRRLREWATGLLLGLVLPTWLLGQVWGLVGGRQASNYWACAANFVACKNRLKWA